MDISIPWYRRYLMKLLFVFLLLAVAGNVGLFLIWRQQSKALQAALAQKTETTEREPAPSLDETIQKKASQYVLEEMLPTYPEVAARVATASAQTVSPFQLRPGTQAWILQSYFKDEQVTEGFLVTADKLATIHSSPGLCETAQYVNYAANKSLGQKVETPEVRRLVISVRCNDSGNNFSSAFLFDALTLEKLSFQDPQNILLGWFQKNSNWNGYNYTYAPLSLEAGTITAYSQSYQLLEGVYGETDPQVAFSIGGYSDASLPRAVFLFSVKDGKFKKVLELPERSDVFFAGW